MKILLQHKKTRLYFQQPGNWVSEIEAASDFKTSQNALEKVRAECLAEVQIVAVFLGGSYVDTICYPAEPASITRPKLRS
jgi:hypothetical protein